MASDRMTAEQSPKELKSWTQTPPLSPPLRHVVEDVVENQTWLDKLADPIQNWLLKIFGQPGQPQRKLKNLLNGTWFGHPVHPALTDVPVGAWSATLLLNLAWLGKESDGMANGADLTLLLGLIGAAGAAVTGVADWSDQVDVDRRVGLLHGLLNTGITVTNLASLIMRRTGRRRAGIALTTLGYAATIFSAYLGGEMTLGKGVGVNHGAFEGGSDDYVAVMDEKDLPADKLVRVDAAGIPAVLVKQGNMLYAIAATCSHAGGPLDEGTLEDGVVQCPWHGSCFRISDGSIVNGPTAYAQPTFSVRVRAGKIELRRLEHA